jgi:hypothetical protein
LIGAGRYRLCGGGGEQATPQRQIRRQGIVNEREVADAVQNALGLARSTRQLGDDCGADLEGSLDVGRVRGRDGLDLKKPGNECAEQKPEESADDKATATKGALGVQRVPLTFVGN